MGLRFVLVILKDTEIQVLVLLEKLVLKYLGFFMCGFVLSASWITDEGRVCRGNGGNIYVRAGNFWALDALAMLRNLQ